VEAGGVEVELELVDGEVDGEGVKVIPAAFAVLTEASARLAEMSPVTMNRDLVDTLFIFHSL
jgi:hypothetical protein